MAQKLFIGGLAFSTSNERLREVFGQAGTVESAAVVTDRETGRSRGFGFVEMEVEDVSAVIRATDGLELKGRPIRVNESEDRNRGGGGGGGGGRGGGRGR